MTPACPDTSLHKVDLQEETDTHLPQRIEQVMQIFSSLGSPMVT